MLHVFENTQWITDDDIVISIMVYYLSETSDLEIMKTICFNIQLFKGEPNNLTDKTILTKSRGYAYKADQLSGGLHCSIYGHITIITVY